MKKLIMLLIITTTLTASLFHSCKKYDKLMAVETGNISNINATSAELDAFVVDVGQSGLTEYGWCINTEPNPTISDYKINNGTKEVYGNYTNILTGLDPATKYYVRSYLSGGGEVLYGQQLELITEDLSFSINYPLANEVLGIGDNYEISWSANISDKIKIDLYKGVSFIKTIVEEIENNGTYQMTVGTGLIDGYDYKIVIGSSENLKVKQESSIFSIFHNPIPMVSSTEILEIEYYNAKAGGSINQLGIDSYINQHGHCWSTSENPTTTNSKTELGSKNTTGVFTSNLANLLPNTLYHVRAYATNNIGTSYGEQRIFTTLHSGTLTDYDGNSYKTIAIGNQLWMAENLKVTHYPDGTTIPLVSENPAWANLGDNNTDDAYCLYNTDANKIYGALYTWAAAMGDNAVSSSTSPSGVQGVCPTGWHLPSNTEWIELFEYLGGTSVAGGKMKEVGTEHWYSPNIGADNTSYFTALPGGRRSSDLGDFSIPGQHGFWWSTTQFDTEMARACYLFYNTGNADNASYPKSRGLSVRCLKD